MRALAALVLALGSASAEVTAARAVQRGQVLAEADLQGPVDELSGFIGMAARRPLFAGRTVRPIDVELPSAVMRQDTVVVLFRRGSLVLRTEGRALKGGAIGERISVTLSGRRKPLSALITDDGIVEIGA